MSAPPNGSSDLASPGKIQWESVIGRSGWPNGSSLVIRAKPGRRGVGGGGGEKLSAGGIKNFLPLANAFVTPER